MNTWLIESQWVIWGGTPPHYGLNMNFRYLWSVLQVLEYMVNVEVRELVIVILFALFLAVRKRCSDICFPVSEGKPALLERTNFFYGSRLLKFSCKMYSSPQNSHVKYSSPQNSSEQIFFVYNFTMMRIFSKSTNNVHNILIAVLF